MPWCLHVYQSLKTNVGRKYGQLELTIIVLHWYVSGCMIVVRFDVDGDRLDTV